MKPANYGVYAGRILEMRKGGDRRPASEIANELLRSMTDAQCRAATVLLVVGQFRKEARRLASVDPEHEINQPLLFDLYPDAIGKYRTAPFIRIERTDGEDFISSRQASGEQIERHDAWDELKTKASAAHRTARRRDNKVHSQELRDLGFDPAKETNEELHSHDDPRICALCGEGSIPGETWEKDHEAAVSVGGPTAVRWTHRTCNRVKGTNDVHHEYPNPG
jgi:hypothetical protein